MPDFDWCKQFDKNRTKCLSDEALGCNWGWPEDFGETTKSGKQSCFPDSRTLWGREVPIVITHGLIFVIVICIPLSLGNLESNVGVQVVSCLGTFVIFAVWLIAMRAKAENEASPKPITEWQVPWVGQGLGVANLIGTVMYSSGFAHYMPSILNESKRTVNVNKLIWLSSTCALVWTLALGYGGATVFGHLFRNNVRADLLEAISNSRQTPAVMERWAQIGVWAFPFLVLIPGIPVACVMLKYNLQQEGAGMSEPAALFWAVAFPFLVALPFLSYHSLLNTAVAWLSVVILSLVDVIIPLRLYKCYVQWKVNSMEESSDLVAAGRRHKKLESFAKSPFHAVQVTPPSPAEGTLSKPKNYGTLQVDDSGSHEPFALDENESFILARHDCPDTTTTHVAVKPTTLDTHYLPSLSNGMIIVFSLLMLLTVLSMFAPLIEGVNHGDDGDDSGSGAAAGPSRKDQDKDASSSSQAVTHVPGSGKEDKEWKKEAKQRLKKHKRKHRPPTEHPDFSHRRRKHDDDDS